VKTISISNSYNVKWYILGFDKYIITECSKIINIRTHRELKQTLNRYSKGYWFGKKFITLANINKLIYKPKIEEELPF